MKAYFLFLRYLIYLNLLHSALIGAFILGPTIFYCRKTGESISRGELPTRSKRASELLCAVLSGSCEGNHTSLDFLLGSVSVCATACRNSVYF